MNFKFKLGKVNVQVADQATVNVEDIEVSIENLNLKEYGDIVKALPAVIHQVRAAVEGEPVVTPEPPTAEDDHSNEYLINQGKLQGAYTLYKSLRATAFGNTFRTIAAEEIDQIYKQHVEMMQNAHVQTEKAHRQNSVFTGDADPQKNPTSKKIYDAVQSGLSQFNETV